MKNFDTQETNLFTQLNKKPDLQILKRLCNDSMINFLDIGPKITPKDYNQKFDVLEISTWNQVFSKPLPLN